MPPGCVIVRLVEKWSVVHYELEKESPGGWYCYFLLFSRTKLEKNAFHLQIQKKRKLLLRWWSAEKLNCTVKMIGVEILDAVICSSPLSWLFHYTSLPSVITR